MIKRIIDYLKIDSNRGIFFTLFSAFICFLYAIYNGIIGIKNNSIWNGSICVYYLLLLFFKMLLSVESRRKIKEEKRTKIIIIVSFVLLFLITLSMIVPSILLIKNKRTYDLGLVPAIAMTVYAVYGITISIINLKKSQKNDNQFIKQIGLINIISALMSILVLQNTLILANNGMGESMTLLSSCSTFAILTLIAVLISFNFRKYLKER